MNKYVKVFISQNPKWEIKCEKCGNKFSAPTKDVLSGADTYDVKCPKCESIATLKSLRKFAKDIEKQLRDLGVKVI